MYFAGKIKINNRIYIRSGYKVYFENGVKKDASIYILEGGKKSHQVTEERYLEMLNNKELIVCQ